MKKGKTYWERKREYWERRNWKNPTRIPVIGREEIEELGRELDAQPPKHPFKDARNWTCPVCEKATLNWSDSLTLEWTDEGERIVITNLTGLLCDSCGEKSYDSAASRIISKEIVKRRPRTGYGATVSSLGGGKLGIYLSKDVLRSVGWRRGTELRVTPITKKKIVVEVDE
ncbi:MAG TPA: hypothetical protein VJ207_06890 [Thermoplasmata archaeon]|nr:hypothetical protein [Thermoplasmata archaeon]